MPLLRSQQNDVFQAIQEAGLEPAEFRWDLRRGRAGVPTEALIHGASDAWFVFDVGENGRHFAYYAPGFESPTDYYGAGSWANQLSYVRQWLSYIKREYFAPDLWSELRKGRELAEAVTIDDAGDDPFTPEEQAAISGQLNEIKEMLVRTERLEGERLRMLEARLDYLEDASKRLGRRDWLAIFYGTVFSWALTGLVSPDGVRQVLMTAAHALGHLFGGSLPQLNA